MKEQQYLESLSSIHIKSMVEELVSYSDLTYLQ
jgi:hypothetical protein